MSRDNNKLNTLKETKDPNFMKKPVKVVVGTALGAALLLGGSTYALWTSTAVADTSATIQTSGSDLSAINEGAWIDSARSAANPEAPAVVIPVINDFRVVPGDKVTFEQNFKISPASDATNTSFSVAIPNEDAIDVATLRDRGIILTAQITDGVTGNVLASSPVAGTTLATDHTFAGNAGENVGVRFVFDFQSTVTADDTKKMQVAVDNAVITANEVN